MQLFPIMCSSVQFMNWILDLPAYWKGRLSVNNNLNLGLLLTQNYHINSAEELKSVSDSIVGMLPELKRQFTHKYKILSLFTHPHSIPNSCFFLSWWTIMQLFSIMDHSVQLVNRIKCLIEINQFKRIIHMQI